MAMDGERGERTGPGGLLRDDLCDLLNVEMNRHQPDSERIRRRITDSLGAVLSLGPEPTAVLPSAAGEPDPERSLSGRAAPPFTPYGDLDHDPSHAASASAGTPPLSFPRRSDHPSSPPEPAEAQEPSEPSEPYELRPRSASRLPAANARPRGGRSRRSGQRRGRILVGAAVAGVTMVLVALLALVGGIPGGDSPNPPVTTVTGAPHPTGSPWTTTATAEPTSAAEPTRSGSTPHPVDTPPPAHAVPQAGQDEPARGGASGPPGTPVAVMTPVAQGRYTSQTVPFPAGSQVQLPADAADWVVFGDGWNGIRTRAAIPVPRIIAFATGSETQASSGFTWFGGFPNLVGSDERGRLSVRGAARLTTVVLQPRQLQIYLGASSGSVRISISSLAGTNTFTVDLPSRQVDGSADAMITLMLPGAIGSTTVTVSGVGDGSWTLAAAVLR
ncbi:hypothetical protein [Frankia sp. R82]|uniref:hypothetical protein n=1 Tax=Frankia sp. R82 TaxID=2950553 RepID=UPI002043D32E|nr:hypothetical protein [Frankia sp. R82]MCM3882423.1 hypothetical protein [Frankia sp. R82]